MLSTWWQKIARRSFQASSRKRGRTERQRTRRFTPNLEGLEDRRLLAANTFAGDLDPSFIDPQNPGPAPGLISTDFGTGLSMKATSVALQADNKIVVVGYTVSPTNAADPAFPSQFVVARLNTDGTTDTSFNPGGANPGVVLTHFGTNTRDQATSVALQPDGKIVVAGSSGTPGNANSNDFAVARYDATGALDTTFDSDPNPARPNKNGRITIDFQRLNDRASAVAIQSDGRIVVAGSASSDGIPALGTPNDTPDTSDDSTSSTENTDFALARMNPDGSQDSDFDADGKVQFDIALNRTAGKLIGSFDNLEDMAIQPDGQIVVVGSTDLAIDVKSIYHQTLAAGFPTTDPGNFALARINTLDGTLDSSFGKTGLQMTDFHGIVSRSNVGASDDQANSVAIQLDGKIIVAGQTRYFQPQDKTPGSPTFGAPVGPFDFALAVYTPTGTIDSTFNTDGVVATDFATDFSLGVDDVAHAVAIRPSGNFILAGSSTRLGEPNFAVDTYNPDGTLDLLFDRPPAPNKSSHGQVVTPSFSSGSADQISNMLIQPNGRILAVGSTETGTATKFALARYHGTNDTLPKVSIDSQTITEGNNGTRTLTFTVSLSAPSTQPVNLHYFTSDASAIGGSDYVPASGNLTFAVGQRTLTIPIQIAGDTVVEPDEKFFVNLDGLDPDVATFVSDKGTGTIIDDDALGVFQFSAAAYEVSERAGFATITVTRTGTATGKVTLNFATSDGTATAGQDYTATTGTLTFEGGEPQTFTVPIIDDALNENDETINLTLSNPAPAPASLGDPIKAVLTITDNDPLPNMTIGDASVVEGNIGATVMEFTVNLSAPSGLPISVDYATADGSATAPSDYLTTADDPNVPQGPSRLVFDPGETAKTIRVTVNGDTTPEADETFVVKLNNISSTAVLADGQATGTIKDDDTVGGVLQPTFAISDAALVEGNSGTSDAVFTVTLSAASTVPVSVDFATANGTAQANSPPAAGDDYVAATGTLTFNPGETSKEIRVQVIGDTTPEANETFNVVLSNPVNARLSADQTKNQGTGTINNDDGGLPTPPPTSVPLTSQQAFVTQVYLDLLKRPVDADGLDYWVKILGQGASRTQVVLGIESTPEYQHVVVQGLFNQYLRRSADPMGLDGFTAALHNGATIEQVTSVIIASPEYLENRGGGTNDGFVAALFQDALGRSISPGEQSFFTQAFASGANRLSVATMILNSTEHRQLLVNGYYVTFLHRSPDANGLAFWVGALQQGARDEEVIGSIVASDEYFTRAAQSQG